MMPLRGFKVATRSHLLEPLSILSGAYLKNKGTFTSQENIHECTVLETDPSLKKLKGNWRFVTLTCPLIFLITGI